MRQPQMSATWLHREGRPISLRFHALSDIGRRRETNEDSFACSEECSLGVVADGMGGHRSGEVASRMAVKLISQYAADLGKASFCEGLKLGQTRVRLKELMEDWTQRANGAIYSKSNRGHDLRDRMGTTLTVLLGVEDLVVIANVGDSRAHRIRQGRIEILSRDHVIYAADRRKKKPGKGSTRLSASGSVRKRKFVTRALGTKPRVKPDVAVKETRIGDAYLLCSDGLTDLVRAEEIRDLIQESADDQAAVEALVSTANDRGGTDNITVVLGRVVADPEEVEDDTETIAYMVD